MLLQLTALYVDRHDSKADRLSRYSCQIHMCRSLPEGDASLRQTLSAPELHVCVTW